MGFFPGMLNPASRGEFKTFAVQVNDLGEVVVQSIDPDGAVASFVTAGNKATALAAIANQLGCHVGGRVFDAEGRDMVRDLTGWRIDSWGELVQELNRRSRRKRGTEVLTLLIAMGQFGPYTGKRWWGHYVLRHSKYEWAVTEAGKAWDQKFWPLPDETGNSSTQPE